MKICTLPENEQNKPDHCFPLLFCQIVYMRQMLMSGTNAIKKADQLHPFLSMHAEIRVPKLPKVMRLMMNRIMAVDSEIST